jgi:NAD(P)-dependent dehydrogenase (short-subunit alcohol dehydrogenase family)
MKRRLDGKVGIITGGTSGIGEAAARLFVQEGARVVIAGRSAERGEALARELGDAAMYQRADVMREADIAALVDAAAARFGRVDCLFNNAGGPDRGSLETVTEEDFDYSMRLLIGAVVFGVKHAARVMKPQKSGCIINNSSIAAHRTHQGGYLYSGAKAAVSHLTRVAGEELGPHGIRVNAISPGAIATPIFWGGSARASTLSDEDNRRKMEKLERNLARATPLPRAGFPHDIAQAAVFLASDEGSFVNCHDLVVDGGRVAQFYERPVEPAR